MSAEATGYVWRHAPYRGADLVVLLAIADLVSDGHENLCFMSVARLSDKARVNRDTARQAVRRFVSDGWLEPVEQSAGGKPSTYRFLYRDELPVVFEARSRSKLSTPRGPAAGAGTPNPRDSRGIPAAVPRGTRGTAAGPTNPRDSNANPDGDAGASAHPAHVAAARNARRDAVGCPQCHGSGWDLVDDPDPRKAPRSVTCAACQGTGYTDPQPPSDTPPVP